MRQEKNYLNKLEDIIFEIKEEIISILNANKLDSFEFDQEMMIPIHVEGFRREENPYETASLCRVTKISILNIINKGQELLFEAVDVNTNELHMNEELIIGVDAMYYTYHELYRQLYKIPNKSEWQ